MQMKNRNGVTLIVLIITIIVLTIILSITLNYGLSEIHDVANKKTESELSIVQEAVMQRYALVKSQNHLGVKASAISEDKPLSADTERPAGFVGTRIADPSTSIEKNFPGVTLIGGYEKGASGLNYEQYYYKIEEKENKAEDDLIELGIEKGDDSKISDDITVKYKSYIINYFTGEVFDIANKKYYKTDMTNDDPVYTQPTQITMQNKNYEFNDENIVNN